MCYHLIDLSHHKPSLKVLESFFFLILYFSKKFMSLDMLKRGGPWPVGHSKGQRLGIVCEGCSKFVVFHRCPCGINANRGKQNLEND